MATSSDSTAIKFPTLCIPRAMLFHTADFVEKQINAVMCSTRSSAFINTIDQKVTKDKEGKEFNVFVITPNQDFTENAATIAVYNKIKADGLVLISIGNSKGKSYFWKVFLYIPNLKSKFAPAVKKYDAPKIMTDDDTEEYRIWREKRAAAKAAKAAKAASKGPWDNIEEGEIAEENFDE